MFIDCFQTQKMSKTFRVLDHWTYWVVHPVQRLMHLLGVFQGTMGQLMLTPLEECRWNRKHSYISVLLASIQAFRKTRNLLDRTLVSSSFPRKVQIWCQMAKVHLKKLYRVIGTGMYCRSQVEKMDFDLDQFSVLLTRKL